MVVVGNMNPSEGVACAWLVTSRDVNQRPSDVKFGRRDVKIPPPGGKFWEKRVLRALIWVLWWPNLEIAFLTKKNRLVETSRLHIVGTETETIKVVGRAL